ncbi:PREDICTED: uncharacterized protein LOC108752761 isoform X2 [Trachymyrmex septentrionalis]|uniref:uncharacterized protein LOC108752761 isoform X2 n=1 Tax=Trachymyrmex septentrionalis TaxID=34720 RepID=UPI00084F1AFB|nr:PREDICTED: uncharacterized protein LOC108752761 isoform X2 [Trachymyrmex septentrionalis]
MNVYDDISETFELPVKNQFEMQSCKIDESESRPNIALKRIGLELDKAETKCFTLKSELNYMMDVCRKAQTEIKGNKEASNISSIMSFKNSDSKSTFERNDYNSEIMDVNRTTNCNIFQRIHNMELKAEENLDTFNLSPKSAQFSSRKSINDDDTIERSENLMKKSQKGLLNVTITPKTKLNKKLPHLIMPTQNMEEDASKEHESYYFPSKMSLEQMTLQTDDESYIHGTPRPSVKDVESVKDPKLNLNMLNTTKARRLVKSRSKTGRSEINSVCRTDNMMPKARKRKTKLRSSISKSTVTTTGFIGRKEMKKRRHKGLVINCQPLVNHSSNTNQPPSNPPKHVKKSNDVVEIFHNTKLKNNNFEESIIHSKDDEAKYEKKPHLPEAKKNPKRIQETVLSSKDGRSENVNQKCEFHDKKNEPDPQMLNHQNNTLAKPQITQEQDKSENPIHSTHNDLGPSVQDETQQCKRAFNRYDDPLFTPNYEMPTLASKLKRSSRSYFSGFNFRNIPFVVGTSVTPSYNLGLNIQQVLSVMKTRQPPASDITPLLIRKVSRGMRPMSVLLGQMNGHYEGSVPNMSSQMTGMFKFNSRENLGRDKRLSMFNLHVGKTQSGRMPKTNAEIIFEKENNVSKQLCKEKVESSNHKTKQQSSSAVSKSDTPTNPKIQQGTSRISLKGNIGDHKMHIPDSHNSKEIRDVLINLHDQFEEMNKKYEKLQSEVDKSNDKSLAKELSTLEKELSVKEEEINTVVGLYKEVMTLKQQMKALNERNSLVCIATELTKRTNKDSFPISVIPEKSQIFGRRQIFNATREPPVSMQLAALLRQIQTFHKKLQLMS